MKRLFYFPLLIILLASLVSGVLPLGQGVAYASPGWVSPTGFVDSGGTWSSETLAYDEDTATYAVETITAIGWGNYLELTHSAINCDRVQVWSSYQSNINQIEIDVFYNSAWDNIYSGPVTVGAFIEYAIGSEQSVTAMRIRYSTSKANRWAGVNEADFNEVVPLPSIANSPDNYPFGTVSEGSSTKTGLTHFTVTNNSAFNVNITISGTDMTGGVPWTLSEDASTGTNIYGLRAGRAGEVEGNDYLTVVPKSSANPLVSGLGADLSQQWGLQLLAPTSFSDGASKSGTVTLTATQA